jgi:hypothetical protein
MAQVAMQQTMDEIIGYLATIDEKLDDVLRARDDAVWAFRVGSLSWLVASNCRKDNGLPGWDAVPAAGVGPGSVLKHDRGLAPRLRAAGHNLLIKSFAILPVRVKPLPCGVLGKSAPMTPTM